jgi:two-component system, OmpR family, response regulator RegX3
VATILLVEDDATLANAMLFALEAEGHGAVRAGGLRDALVELGRSRPDLVILDVMLPDGDGFALCRRIRQTSRIPILFVTAREAEEDAVKALDSGGDDYVTKPFRVRELLSRVRALLRRAASAPASADPRVLSSGDIEIRLAGAAASRAGVPLHLTPAEYRILCFLVRHPDQTLPRDAILQSLSDVGPLVVDDNTLSVYVRRLREKIEADASAPRRIVTVRNVGYRWSSGA